jgi:hypothetical protein
MRTTLLLAAGLVVLPALAMLQLAEVRSLRGRAKMQPATAQAA